MSDGQGGEPKEIQFSFLESMGSNPIPGVALKAYIVFGVPGFIPKLDQQ